MSALPVAASLGKPLTRGSYRVTLAALSVSAVMYGLLGVANGMNNVMRTVGGAIGAQIAATLLAHNLIHGLPSERGYELAFMMGAIALVLAFCVSFTIPAPGG